jgi:hypothetical protein
MPKNISYEQNVNQITQNRYGIDFLSLLENYSYLNLVNIIQILNKIL